MDVDAVEKDVEETAFFGLPKEFVVALGELGADGLQEEDGGFDGAEIVETIAAVLEKAEFCAVVV